MLGTITKFWLLFVMLTMGIACTEEGPEITSEPNLDIQSVITGLPGESIVLSGLISDPAGVSEILIRYDRWDLAKVISIPQGITQFELDYSFKVPDEEEVGSTHTIEISSTNGGGKVSSTNVTVELSLDNVPPAITIALPNDAGTYIIGAGSEFNLNFSVEDETALSSVRVIGFGINEVFSPTGNSFTYDEEVDFLLAGTFDLKIYATDEAGNTASTSITVVIEESLKFAKFYLADVATEAELNSDVFGVPMLTNNSTSPEREGVEFEAYYYSKVPDTEIRFLAQKTSFGPFSFGAGENEGELILGNDNTVAPIILPEVGYYKIIVNLTSFTYTMEKYTPTDDTFDFIHVMGRGVEVNNESTCTDNDDASSRCWHFLSGKQLTVDPNNPYLFTATVELFDQPDDEEANGFILGASPDGWAPFWRFDVGDEIGVEPEKTIPGGGANYVFGPESYGIYTFEFDTHLNRVKIIPQ